MQLNPSHFMGNLDTLSVGMDANLLNSPWAITPEALSKIASFDHSQLEDPMTRAEVTAADEGKTHKERLNEFMSQFDEQLRVDDNGTATLEVSGPLMPNPDIYDRYYHNGADSVRIANLIQAAANAPEIERLVLLINSPGGMVIGTPEMGSALRDFNSTGKQSIAFADTLMASAAYWVGSQASEVYSTESALVGSIGVIRPHIDASAAHEKEGLKVEIFRGGKHKVAGAMGTAMTDEQRQHIQEGVDACHEDFKSTVNNYRNIPNESMQGQVFYGKDAVGVGIIDSTVSSVSDLFKRVRGGVSSDLKVEMVDNSIGAMNIDKETPNVDEVDAESEELAQASADLETANSLITEITASEKEAKDFADELEATVDALTAERDDANASNEAVTSELESLKVQHDDLKENFKAKVEIEASIKAASIAADSGIDPIDIAGGQSEDAQASHLTEKEAWAEYSNVRTEKGNNEARAFYVKSIEGKF